MSNERYFSRGPVALGIFYGEGIRIVLIALLAIANGDYYPYGTFGKANHATNPSVRYPTTILKFPNQRLPQVWVRDLGFDFFEQSTTYGLRELLEYVICRTDEANPNLRRGGGGRSGRVCDRATPILHRCLHLVPFDIFARQIGATAAILLERLGIARHFERFPQVGKQVFNERH